MLLFVVHRGCILEAAKQSSSTQSISEPLWPRCIDLGCGTGLMGPLLRGHVGHLSGVDLSSGMVDKARQRGCYDDLAVGELAGHLQAAQQGWYGVLRGLLHVDFVDVVGSCRKTTPRGISTVTAGCVVSVPLLSSVCG